MPQVSQSGMVPPKRGVKPNYAGNHGRWKLIVGGIIVVGFAVAFATLTVQALSIRAHSSSEFSKYVVTHHIGSSEIVDDDTGVQTDFCILHLNQSIDSNQLENETLQLMKVYNGLDGGDHLTIEYTSGGKTQILADAIMMPGDKSVSITMHRGNEVQVVQKDVDWGQSDPS